MDWELIAAKLSKIESNLNNCYEPDTIKEMRLVLYKNGSGKVDCRLGYTPWLCCQWGSIDRMITSIDWYLHHIEYCLQLREDAPIPYMETNFGKATVNS